MENIIYVNTTQVLLSYLPHFFAGCILYNPEQGISNGRENETLDLPLFDFATIAYATENFSNQNELGHGGFGPVYKVFASKHWYAVSFHGYF